ARHDLFEGRRDASAWSEEVMRRRQFCEHIGWLKPLRLIAISSLVLTSPCLQRTTLARMLFCRAGWCADFVLRFPGWSKVGRLNSGASHECHQLSGPVDDPVEAFP